MPEQPSGYLLVNKPEGISSFDCIRRLRSKTGWRKFGHTGTLDPMASGLMILLSGKATKQADTFSRMDKCYTAGVTLGAISDTGDKEGVLNKVSSAEPSLDELEAALEKFVGTISQKPPRYSAIKLDGVRAYNLARAGKSFDIPSREVVIHKITLRKFEYPLLEIEALVSSGTYIRSLAHDLGEQLGTGAYLTSLVRTSVGPYLLRDAKPLEEIGTKNFNELLIQI